MRPWPGENPYLNPDKKPQAGQTPEGGKRVISLVVIVTFSVACVGKLLVLYKRSKINHAHLSLCLIQGPKFVIMNGDTIAEYYIVYIVFLVRLLCPSCLVCYHLSLTI